MSWAPAAAPGQAALGYLKKSQRWWVRFEPRDRDASLLDVGSFLKFREAMNALLRCKAARMARIELLIRLLDKASDIDSQARARFALLLHLFLLHARARERRRRGRDPWDRLLGALSAVLAAIPPTAPPITLWLLAHHRHPLPERAWALLEQRLSTYAARPPSDEVGQLACWLAARELLRMAIEQGHSMRVAQALRHYKLYISGRYGHAVGKGPLSVVVEDDVHQLADRFPEFFDRERQERNFFDDWLLARFSMLKALRVTFLAYTPRWRRWAMPIFVIFVSVSLLLVGLLTLETRFALFRGLEAYRPWIAPAFFACVLLLSCCLPDVQRVLYPRLFAGAILGWSTVLGELATHRLFAEGKEMSLPQRLCNGETHYHYLSLLLIAVPFYFLYGEAYAALESKAQAFRRAGGVLLWALFLVALVGSLGSVGLERIVCAGKIEPAAHLTLFMLGCIVSLYFTIVVHLVWGDEAMSATLAHGDGRG